MNLEEERAAGQGESQWRTRAWKERNCWRLIKSQEKKNDFD
jgi:hypothetical protein